MALEFIGSHEENNRDDLRLVTGKNCGSGPCGNIFTIHVLRNRYKMTALHPTTNVMFSILYHHFASFWGSNCATFVDRSKPSFVNVIYIYIYTHRVSQEEWTKLRESVPYVKIYRYNPKHLYPKLNGYGDNGQRSLKL